MDLIVKSDNQLNSTTFNEPDESKNLSSKAENKILSTKNNDSEIMPSPKSTISKKKSNSSWGKIVEHTQFKKSTSSRQLATSEMLEKSSIEYDKPKKISKIKSLRNIFKSNTPNNKSMKNKDSTMLNIYQMERSLSEGASKLIAPFASSFVNEDKCLNKKKFNHKEEKQRCSLENLKNQENIDPNGNDISSRLDDSIKENLFHQSDENIEEKRYVMKRSDTGSSTINNLLRKLRINCIGSDNFDSTEPKRPHSCANLKSTLDSVLPTKSCSEINLSCPLKKVGERTEDFKLELKWVDNKDENASNDSFETDVTATLSDEDECNKEITNNFEVKNDKKVELSSENSVNNFSMISSVSQSSLSTDSNIYTTPLKSEKKKIKLKTVFKFKRRKISDNLLDDAASVNQDSPPSKNSKSYLNKKYYKQKRCHSKIEPSESVDNLFRIKRPRVSKSFFSMMKLYSRRKIKTINFFVNESDKLGLSIEKQKAVRPFYIISKIDQNGVAAKSNLLQIGDEIIRVCGKKIRGMSEIEAKNSIRNCTGSIELRIAREPNYKINGDPWGDSLSRTQSDSDICELKENDSSNQDTLSENTLKEISSDNNAPNIRNKLVANSMTRSVSQPNPTTQINVTLDQNYVTLENNSINLFNDKKNLSTISLNLPSQENYPKLTGMKKFQFVKKHNLNQTILNHQKSHSKNSLTVCLKKGGKKKLGFSIVGGVDSPKGKMGIFVKDVLPNGQAADTGIIMPHDQILSINGKAIDELTHAETIQAFKTAKPGEIILDISRKDTNHTPESLK